jgi:hypothetical protein
VDWDAEKLICFLLAISGWHRFDVISHILDKKREKEWVDALEFKDTNIIPSKHIRGLHDEDDSGVIPPPSSLAPFSLFF